MPVYRLRLRLRLRLEKRRRAGHRGRFESRNVTDSGRIITEALEATAHARALLELDADVYRLLIWHQTTPHDGQGYRRAVRIGPRQAQTRRPRGCRTGRRSGAEVGTGQHDSVISSNGTGRTVSSERLSARRGSGVLVWAELYGGSCVPRSCW